MPLVGASDCIAERRFIMTPPTRFLGPSGFWVLDIFDRGFHTRAPGVQSTMGGGSAIPWPTAIPPSAPAASLTQKQKTKRNNRNGETLKARMTGGETRTTPKQVAAPKGVCPRRPLTAIGCAPTLLLWQSIATMKMSRGSGGRGQGVLARPARNRPQKRVRALSGSGEPPSLAGIFLQQNQRPVWRDVRRGELMEKGSVKS